MLVNTPFEDPTATLRQAPAAVGRWIAVAAFVTGLATWAGLPTTTASCLGLATALAITVAHTARGRAAVALLGVGSAVFVQHWPDQPWLVAALVGALGAWGGPWRSATATQLRAAAIAVIGATWAVPVAHALTPVPFALDPLIATGAAGLWLFSVAWEHDHPQPPSARHIRRTVSAPRRDEALHLRAQTIAVTQVAPTARARRQAVEVCERALDLHRRRDALIAERDRLSQGATPTRPAHAAVIGQALRDVEDRLQHVAEGLDDARTTCTAASLGVGLVDHDDLSELLAQLHTTTRELQARRAADRELVSAAP